MESEKEEAKNLDIYWLFFYYNSMLKRVNAFVR